MKSITREAHTQLKSSDNRKTQKKTNLYLFLVEMYFLN